MPLSNGAVQAILDDNEIVQSGATEDLDIESFAGDIRKYIHLIHICLDVGSWEVIDTAFQQSKVPNNRNESLYVKALSFIRDQADNQILHTESKEILTQCVDYLIDILPRRL